MLIDSSALDGEGSPYDLAIVGSGPAGLSIAHRLHGSGLRIILIEAGDTAETRGGRDDYAGTVDAASGHPPLDLYRLRALGGTSRIWGGRVIPYDPIDFKARDWIEGPSWPISYATVAAYYPQAFAVCEAGDGETDPARALPALQAELVEGLDGRIVQTTLERFSRPTDFWKRFGPALTADRDVHVLPNAAVTRIALSPMGTNVESLEIDVGGRRCNVAARAFVLAGGGLEVPRLLLESDDLQKDGIGNESGHVGRHYMGHLCATFGDVTLDPSRRTALGYERDHDGIYVRRRLWLTEEAQRAHKLLNVTFRTHFPEPADPAHGDGVLSAMFLAKALVQREFAARFVETPVPARAYAGHAINLLSGAWPLAKFARAWIRDRILADRKLPSVIREPLHGRTVLEFHCEQSPCSASRVTLQHERDRHGMRRLHLDWRCNDSDIEALTRAYRLLAQELHARGAGILTADLSKIGERVRHFGLMTGHHIGTTRMAADARTGVVDGDCRVHGVGNLFIAGSSVLPTSGQANPTLTIVALALRLADHLRERLQHRSVRQSTTSEVTPNRAAEAAVVDPVAAESMT